MSSIDERYLENVAKVWNGSINTNNPLGENVYSIRDDIYDSWKQSQKWKIDPLSKNDLKVCSKKMAWLTKENALLIKVAFPYMKELFENMGETSFMMQLIDKKGYVLKTISDDRVIRNLAFSISIQKEGYVVSEEVMGTNSSALALRLKKPMRVIGEEHYQKRVQSFACSSAPVFSPEKELLGCITMMSVRAAYKLNTLGIVKAAADAIEREIKSQNAINEAQQTAALLSACIEATQVGIILLDTEKKVLHHNVLAAKYLKMGTEELQGRSIYDLIPKQSFPAEIRNFSRPVKDYELSLRNKKGYTADIILSVTIINSPSGKSSILLSFDQQEHAHTLANKLTGSRATYTFDSIIGKSTAIKRTLDLAKRSAYSDSNLLITGESGTGKELLAQAIHNASPRANKPFIAVNCGSIPKNLIATELFGYEYGAFTGANKQGNPGKFELANGGTIFLDEIADMPFDLQVMLLRILQEKEVTRVGGKYARKIDVRVISATNRDLLEAISKDLFRTDLYYRLNVLSISVPPLRDRFEDIEVLSNTFVEQYGKSLGKKIIGISQAALQLLYQHKWPGNVRELENTIERAVNLAQNEIITPDDLPELQRIADSAAYKKLDKSFLAEVEKLLDSKLALAGLQLQTPVFANGNHSNGRFADTDYDKVLSTPDMEEYSHLVSLFRSTHGHTKTVAQELGIPLSTLYNKIRKYNINPKDYRNW